jgi:FkbM family methyltransferase
MHTGAGLERKIAIGDREFDIVSDDDYLAAMGPAFEPELVALYRRLVRSQHRVLDVGANIGMTAILFGQLAAHVDAYEASPSTFSLLERNVKASGCRNVDLHNIGLGDKEATSQITFSRNNRSGGFVSESMKVSEGHVTESIVLRPLDSIKSGRVDFIKIDVEGYEEHVIRGGLETIRRDRPVVVMELNHWCLALQRSNVPDYFDFLRGIFPVLQAVEGEERLDVHQDAPRYHAMYHHINGKRYNNLVGAFSSDQLR